MRARYDLLFALGIALLVLGWFALVEAREEKEAIYQDLVTKYQARSSFRAIREGCRESLKSGAVEAAEKDLRETAAKAEELRGQLASMRATPSDRSYDSYLKESEVEESLKSAEELAKAAEQTLADRNRWTERCVELLRRAGVWRVWNWSARLFFLFGGTMASLSIYRLIDLRRTRSS